MGRPGRQHVLNEYLRNCPHAITVQLIGCGGTGSHMLTALARIHVSLVKLGRQGLWVEAIDPDKVSAANIGRQAFFEGDLDHYKSTVLISRINRAFGVSWAAFEKEYNPDDWESCNIIITCVDDPGLRYRMEQKVDYLKRTNLNDVTKPLYWLDIGNDKYTGQVVLGTMRLPAFDKQIDSKRKLLRATEMWDYSKIKVKDSGPSCSTLESLGKQDLFINSFMANYAGTMLWQLLFKHEIEYHGVFVNLETLTTNPILV